MTTPPGSPLPNNVATAASLGALLQNITAAKAKARTDSQIPGVVTSTPANFAMDVVTDVFGAFVGHIASDAEVTDLQGPDDVADLVTDFFEDLPTTQVFLTALSYLLAFIYDGEPEDWDTLEEIEAGLESWLLDIPILGDIIAMIDKILKGNTSGLTGIPAALAALMGLRWDQVDTVAEDVVELKPQVVRAQDMIAVRSNRGLHEGPDPTAESSFDFQIMSLLGHTHGYNATGDTARTTSSAGVSSMTITSTLSRWAFIRCWRDDPKSVLSWQSWRTGAVTAFILDVYKMEEDGSYTWIASTDNLAGELTTVKSWMQFRIPEEVITEPGTVIGIQFRASHPVNISGVEFDNDSLPPWGFRPTANGGVRAAIDAPTTLSTLTMDGVYNGLTPYVQFGTDIGQVDNPRRFFDDFSGGIQNRFWKKLRGGASANDLSVSGGAAAWGGAPILLFGLQAGIYTRPLLTDHMAIEFTVLDPDDSSACGVFLSSNWDMNEFVMLSVESDRFQLWTGNGTNTSNWTTRITHGLSTGASSTWKLEYNPAASNPAHNPTLTPNTYYVSRNGVVLNFWTDSTNVVSHGRGRRFGGLMVTSNLSTSGRIDNFNFYDVT